MALFLISSGKNSKNESAAVQSRVQREGIYQMSLDQARVAIEVKKRDVPRHRVCCEITRKMEK